MLRRVSTSEEGFAANMRAAREAQSLTQAEFSRLLKEAGLEHFHPTTVARVERGERQVRLPEARLIAQQLGISLDQMMLSEDDFADVLRYVEAVRAWRRAVGQIRAWLLKASEAQVDIQELIDAVNQKFDRPLSTDQLATLKDVVEQDLFDIVQEALGRSYPVPWAASDEPPF